MPAAATEASRTPAPHWIAVSFRNALCDELGIHFRLPAGAGDPARASDAVPAGATGSGEASDSFPGPTRRVPIFGA